MSDRRNLDTRNHLFRHFRGLDVLEQNAAFASNALEGDHTVTVEGVNPVTGSAARVISNGAPANPAILDSSTMLIARALEHVDATADVMGFDETEKAEFVADPTVPKTSGGAAAVHLQQSFRGLRVFQMTRTVSFSKKGEIVDVSGESAGIPDDLDIEPKVGAAEAVLAAARYIASPPPAELEPEVDAFGEPVIDPPFLLGDYTPRVLASFPLPNRPTVLEKGPFADSPKAELVVFYTAPNPRLGWEIQLTLPGLVAQYDLVVAADEKENPEILFCDNTVRSIREVIANVYTSRPDVDPHLDVRTLVPLPRPLTDYPAEPVSPLPPEFPFGWVDDNGTIAGGNSTIAVKGLSTDSFSGSIDDQGRLVFNAEEATGDDQKVANIFYYCNFMHDFFFLLGFDEKAGNFQQINFTGNGRGGDPVVARAHPGAVIGTANMLTRADGVSGNMNMGLVTRSGRHTAFDADVVFHEYTHGVSNRLVGGKLDALALQAPQSKAMGEGWSDFFAITVQNFGATVERNVIGDWAVNKPGGLRHFAYDENFPNGFDSLGLFSNEHARGEIWCATLMQMTRNLVAALADRTLGYRISWRIVVDGMKLTPSQPSFLDARNGILKALDALGGGAPLSDTQLINCRRAVWEAFAKFGMGINASCPNGQILDIVADHTVPEI